MQKTALYYPEIVIPSGKWIRQAVLYFDEIASIVPHSIELWTGNQAEHGARQNAELPTLDVLSEDLDVLSKEGQYRSINPDGFIEYDSFERAAFQDDFISALVSAEFQSLLGDRQGWLYDAAVHLQKATPELINLLIQDGYARKGDDPEWVQFETSTANLYMSILAKYLARQDWNDTVPCTASENIDFNALAFRKCDSATGTCTASVLIRNVLPCPNENTPLTKVLKFKERRKNELLRFREVVASLEADIAEATTIEEIKSIAQGFGDRKNVALADLNKSFVEDFAETALQSVRSLIRLGSPTLWLTGVAVAQGANAVTQLPLSATMTGIGIVGSLEVGITFASRILQRRLEFRNSAYSYVYYAGRELGAR